MSENEAERLGAMASVTPLKSASVLGGGMNAAVLAGRSAGLVEKRHLVMARLMRERASQVGRDFIDVGTDYEYPFYDNYPPTMAAMAALRKSSAAARHYPSSYGTDELRRQFVAFMSRQFGVELRSAVDVMVTTGASQVFDALSRTYAGRWVLLPELALSTVNSIAIGNGARVDRVPLDSKHRPDLAVLENRIRHLGASEVRFLYVNSPTNPTGTILDYSYLVTLVGLARRHRILVLHDHDSWFTSHTGQRAANILEVPGANGVAVTVLSLSKELGLPGLRVGLVAGNSEVVNALRIHNSEFCVMIPEFCQAAAAAALRQFAVDDTRRKLQTRISHVLETAFDGWLRLGWPREAIWCPDAGYKFLFRPPPRFAADGEFSAVELFDFLLARDAAVKLSTSRSFNDDRAEWMRMILMQPERVLNEMFERLDMIGVRYDMRQPDHLAASLRATLNDCDYWNL
jgi:aspartate/methionine/tyrosine aminotransferase